jgi:hypothetical protein
METVIYYRNSQLITEADWIKIVKVWGLTPFNFIERHVIDQNSGSGLHIVTELLAVIWNDKLLNEKDTVLKERIKKGLTHSSAYGRDYVERNLLRNLIWDALNEFNKIAEEPVDLFQIPYMEFYRLYNIPTETVMDDVNKDECKTNNIPDPPRKVKYSQYFGEPETDQCSVFQKNYICVDEDSRYSVERLSKEAHQKFSFLRKLYLVEDYIQVYVHDNYGSTKALENVLCFLEDNGIKFNK